MKNELLKYLKSFTKDWLQYYQFDSPDSLELTSKKFSNQELYWLIQDKLEQISATAVKRQTLVILIAESNPFKFIAAFLAGVIAEVNLFLCDPAWQQREWQQVLELVQPDLIFGDRNIKDLLTKLKYKVERVDHQVDIFPESLIMIPTGGTSGKIKFAMHTWSTLTASVIGFRDYFNCPQINSACTLPFYHVSGLMQLMRSLITQGELAIFDYKVAKINQISFYKPDYFISLVPTQLQSLITTIPEWLSQFKTVLLGGAPARRSLLDSARKHKIPLALTYGMTETASGIVVLKPEDFWQGNNSNGLVLPQAQVEIVNTCHQDLTQQFSFEQTASRLIERNVGLIKIKSKSLYLGYYPQFSIPDSSLTTDDLGYFDSNGYLHLVGRNSQKIITGGKNVFPLEVESAIYATNLVKDICVIGIPDLKWGQAVTAVYVPVESSSPPIDTIKQTVQFQLAKYKQPKNWIELKQLPRNNRGKINYQQLQDQILQILSSR